MSLYQITAPSLTQPTFVVGITLARKMKKWTEDATIQEVPDPSGPPGCVVVIINEFKKAREFKLEFHPRTASMVLDRLLNAEGYIVDGWVGAPPEYYRINTDRDCLCVSPSMRDALIKGVRKVSET